MMINNLISGSRLIILLLIPAESLKLDSVFTPATGLGFAHPKQGVAQWKHGAPEDVSG